MALSPTSSRGAPSGSVPTGGTTGQALEKASNTNFDTTWASVTAAVASVFTRTGAVVAADGDYYGTVAAAKTGAVQASRYVGATASGAPVAGTFAVGDLVIDQAGGAWTCTVAGTPGTWAPAVPASSITNTHISPGAAIAASKVQGGGASQGVGLQLLSTTTLGSDGTFDVSGIDQTYSDLILIGIVRGTRAAATVDTLWMRFNNDSGAHYDNQFLDSHGSTTASSVSNTDAAIYAASIIPASTATAGDFGYFCAEIPGYASTVWNKTANCDYSSPITAGSLVWRGFLGGVWRSTAAITRVQVLGQTTANLLAGSQLRIYGRF